MPFKKKFKTQPSAGKEMLTLFFGCIWANFGTLSRERCNSKHYPL
jgi:hypothetical protein